MLRSMLTGSRDNRQARSHTVLNGAEIGKPSRCYAQWSAVVKSMGGALGLQGLELGMVFERERWSQEPQGSAS
jgi:hypothetical protein